MRTNLPVTQRELPLPPGRTLVSVTDLKGRITYCNDAFVQASGFRRDELLGQPHNLIRHPDVPAEAFRDLWATVQAGRPWTGVVKNRCKNGDYYWVEAHASPLRETTSRQAVSAMGARVGAGVDAGRAGSPSAVGAPPAEVAPSCVGTMTGPNSRGASSSSVRDGSPSRASARYRKISVSMLPPRFQAWTLPQVSVSRTVHGS